MMYDSSVSNCSSLSIDPAHRQSGRAKLALASALLFGALASSATPSAAEAFGSCINTPSGYCTEYAGASFKGQQTPRKACDAIKMTYLEGACPIEGLVGSCVQNKGKNNETRGRYYTNFPGYGMKLTQADVAIEGARQCAQAKGQWVLAK